MSDDLTPHFEDVQAHYDLSDDFFRLFLDPTQTYSCAYFERDDMTLEEAQIAKIDLALGKLGLQPGMTLLDVGCGWGATMMRAVEKYDVNVVGLTLSKNQAQHVERLIDKSESPRCKRILLQGWEQFDLPVDRIVSIGAFEHFGHERYDAFFTRAHRLLPEDGVMLLHTITGLHPKEIHERGLPMSFTFARFLKFIVTEIFPVWAAAVDTDGGRPRQRKRVHRDPRTVVATPLREDSRHLVRGAGSPQRSSDRAAIRGSLRALHEVPDRLRRDVPHRIHRRQPVHLCEATTNARRALASQSV